MSRRWMGRSMLLAGLAAVPLGGCIMIPYPHPPSRIEGSRRSPSEAEIGAIVPGQTTRADLLLTLGEPDHVSPDERLMVWRWSTSEWSIFFAAGAGYSGTMGTSDVPIRNHHAVSLDERGVVVGHTPLDAKQFAAACADPSTIKNAVPVDRGDPRPTAGSRR